MIRHLFDSILNKKPSDYNQIDSLDGLRAIAVLLVLLSHLSNADLHLLPLLSFSGVGKVGVWLFFVLSSFLLTLQFLNKKEESLLSAKLWLNYLIRRFFRIYPLFTVVMLVSYALSGSGYSNMGGVNDLASRLSLQAAKGIEWSILVEFRYYLVLPIIVLLIAYPLRRQLLYVLSAVIAAVILSDVTRPPIDLVSLRPYISIFILGSFTAYLYWLLQQRVLDLPLQAKWTFEILAASIALLIFLLTPSVYSRLIGKSVPIEYWHGDLTFFALLWSLFIFSYMNGIGHIESLLAKNYLRIIGIVSFGLYLWHPPIIEFVKQNFHVHSSVQALLAMLFMFTVSCLTYFMVERPFMRIKLSWQSMNPHQPHKTGLTEI